MCENVAFGLGGDSVEIIDQTRLPAEEVRLSLRTLEECEDAIARLAVRGAPAIGIFAAHAFALLVGACQGEGAAAWIDCAQQVRDRLAATRPTAVNLVHALDAMYALVEDACDEASPQHLDLEDSFGRFLLAARLREAARQLQADDAAACKRMAELGLTLIEDGWGIITHCNAGPLATSAYGTALGPALLGHERGMDLRVFADETRPLLQGARLTAYELMRAGVDTTLICDNMAASVLAQGWVQAAFVGADRIAANGDTANKIGTSMLALACARHGVPLYVVAPTSTIDLACASGADIPIELRDASEITRLHYGVQVAPKGVKCYNPSFDVTEADLIAAIVTERGIVRPPYREGLRALFA